MKVAGGKFGEVKYFQGSSLWPQSVLGVVELEEEQLARLQGLEVPFASGTPEVDLLGLGQTPQEAEPVVARAPRSRTSCRAHDGPRRGAQAS